MAGKKALLGATLGRTGVAAASLRLAAPPADQLLILAYHRVLDLGDEATFPQDPELVSASVADFERQMRFVRKHFTPLCFAEVLDCIDRNRALPARSLVVTFDDGHLDNYTNAYPVLRALGVPACIFLSTDYIGSIGMFWFDRVALLLYCAPAGEWRVGDRAVRLRDDDLRARRRAAGNLLRRLKVAPDIERRAQLGMLEAQLARHVPQRLVPSRSAMNWDEVREMSRHGIEFGSHTCSHPVLTRLGDSALEDELARSRQVIAERLARPVDTIAYPIGKVGTFDERVIAMSRRLGYRLGISYETGTNRIGVLERYRLRRLAVERYTGFSLFKSMLAFPTLLG